MDKPKVVSLYRTAKKHWNPIRRRRWVRVSVDTSVDGSGLRRIAEFNPRDDWSEFFAEFLAENLATLAENEREVRRIIIH